MGDSHVGLQARLMSPGAAQDHRRAQQLRHHRDLHQPAAREDRRDVRLARDHDRWQGAEVLRLGPPRRAPHRDAQGRHRRGRQPHPRQGREEQGRAAVQAGRVRHHVRPGHQPRGRPDRHGRRARASSARPAPGTPTRATSSARARRTPASFLRDNPDLANELEKKILEKLGIGAQVDAPRRLTSTWPSRRRSTSDHGRAARPAGPPADPYEAARAICCASSRPPRGPGRSSPPPSPARASRSRSPPSARPAGGRPADRRRRVRRWLGLVPARRRGLSRRAIGQELARARRRRRRRDRGAGGHRRAGRGGAARALVDGQAAGQPRPRRRGPAPAG